MVESLKFPTPGCIVEFMEDNSIQIAIVLEAANGRLRLLLPSRRETKLAQNRLLPWIGPQYSGSLSREDYLRLLESHKKARENKIQSINMQDVWELSQGEIDQAEAVFFAELVENEPGEDIIAAYGRALLDCKTHFRFQPPYFLVYNQETVDKRLEEQKIRSEREALVSGGANFLRSLWEIASRRKSKPLDPAVIPEDKIAERIQKLLHARMINPETQDDEPLWHLLSKGLPDVPHLPLQLLQAWDKLPDHYNFWLDRADYETGDSWWKNYESEVLELCSGASSQTSKDIVNELPFISIDSATTQDIDDAFHIQRTDQGWRLTVALACPALFWPFGAPLDKKVLHRGTSLYLPEGDLHMLPQIMGLKNYSLHASQLRPALLFTIELAENGDITSFKPEYAAIKLAANLNYKDVQTIIDSHEQNLPSPQNNAAPYADQLILAHKFALAREQFRIGLGAIIMRKSEQDIILENDSGEIKVSIVPQSPQPDAQRLVAEMMVAASASFGDWAVENNLPLIFRTQNVALPREYAGIWSSPEDLSKIMRSLAPSILEASPKPHAALGMTAYAPITSPLRRYTDLVNEAQILHFLKTGLPRWKTEEVETILNTLSPVLDAAQDVQRFRPRYWRLLYFRQQGDRHWWRGTITEENENFVNVALPDEGIFVRGRRNLFEERACPGMLVDVRLGKINPLYNEINILEAVSAE